MTLELTDRQLDDMVSGRAAVRLRAFRRDAERLFPGRISHVILFGSRARGDARRDSDYDVAVFIKDLGERRLG
jgi:predicted nucleotidyltransferase